jgi:hypothetical protein
MNFLFFFIFYRFSNATRVTSSQLPWDSACLRHLNSVRGISFTFTTSYTLAVAILLQEDATEYLKAIIIKGGKMAHFPLTYMIGLVRQLEVSSDE